MRWFYDITRPERSLAVKLVNINWPLVALVTGIACVGFAMLYSAANGSMQPWAARQMMHFCAGMTVMLAVGILVGLLLRRRRRG